MAKKPYSAIRSAIQDGRKAIQCHTRWQKSHTVPYEMPYEMAEKPYCTAKKPYSSHTKCHTVQQKCHTTKKVRKRRGEMKWKN